MAGTKEAEGVRPLPTQEEILRGLEASSQLLRLSDAILTPKNLLPLSEGYGGFTLLAPHVWIAPHLDECFAQTEPSEYPEFIIVSGGVASGKTELVRRTGRPRVRTATTRPPREREVRGQDYDFISSNAFLRLGEEGFFAETVRLGEFWYGTPWRNIGEAMETPGAGCVLCVVEQEGVRNLHPQIVERYRKYPIRVTIIPELTPWEYLAQIIGSRLRKLDDYPEIFWRLSQTVDNMRQAPQQTDIFIGNSFQSGGLEESVTALNMISPL